MTMARWLLLPCAAAMSVDELSTWLWTPNGLNYPKDQARQVAEKEAPILTQCQVTLDDLVTLKDALYSTTALDMPMDYVKSNLLDMAKQHVDAKELKLMFYVLYSSTGLNLMKSESQQYALQLVKSYAESQQLQDLYRVLSSVSGLWLSKSESQKWAMDLTKRGCDPTAFFNSYKGQSGTKEQRMDAAADSCVRANLNGEVRKYAKNGEIYNAKEFQEYYKETWVREWANAPFEKKKDARDWHQYTTSQFRIYDKTEWEKNWLAATEATQQRLAENGKPYTLKEFVSHYHDEWQTKWWAAPELPCVECHQQGIIV